MTENKPLTEKEIKNLIKKSKHFKSKAKYLKSKIKLLKNAPLTEKVSTAPAMPSNELLQDECKQALYTEQEAQLLAQNASREAIHAFAEHLVRHFDICNYNVNRSTVISSIHDSEKLFLKSTVTK